MDGRSAQAGAAQLSDLPAAAAAAGGPAGRAGGESFKFKFEFLVNFKLASSESRRRPGCPGLRLRVGGSAGPGPSPDYAAAPAWAAQTIAYLPGRVHRDSRLGEASVQLARPPRVTRIGEGSESESASSDHHTHLEGCAI